jgi:hypothetical protein
MSNGEIDRKIAALEYRVDRWATAIAALWHDLEKRLGTDEVVKLRRWFQLILNHTEPQPDQAARVAHMAGAAQVLLVAHAQRVELLLADDTLRFLDPPHPLILLATFEAYGGEPGIEVRS